MSRSIVLLIDAIISLVLGVALVASPKPFVDLLGIPSTQAMIYPSILGAVVIGIAIALFIEWRRKPNELVGLGVGGAIAIDLCAALSLAAWLLFGGLNLPVRGRLLFWSIVVVLIAVSGLGLLSRGKQTYSQ